MNSTLEELKALVRKHARGQRTDTGIPRISLTLSETVTELSAAMVEPIVCFVLQGAKCINLGGDGIHYGAGKYFVASCEVPAIGQVAEASRAHPYLAISLQFDPPTIASLLLDMPKVEDPEFVCGLGISPMEAELHDALLRLIRLKDRPAEIPVLAPLIEREILFRLLQGPQGPKLRQIAQVDGRLAQVRRALAWIRGNYAKPFKVDDLARMTGMSVSVFHRHFKAATLMTPIQYQKRFRLFEARRLLLAEPGNTAGVAFAVGYESASQFSREYARLFGSPPARDARKLRVEPMAEPGSAQPASARA